MLRCREWQWSSEPVLNTAKIMIITKAKQWGTEFTKKKKQTNEAEAKNQSSWEADETPRLPF